MTVRCGRACCSLLMRFLATWAAMLWVSIALANPGLAADSCDAETSAGFPSGDLVDLYGAGNRSSVEHQQYVVLVFESMSGAHNKCSNAPTSRNVSYEGIRKSVFAAGAQSIFAAQQEQFGFNNARTLVNLLGAAPPRKSVGAVSAYRSEYCLDETCPGRASTPASSPPSQSAQGGCECSDCNVWFNDVFLDTLLQTAVESHDGIVASGMCWQNSPLTADCRDVTLIRNQPTKQRRRNVPLADCTEPWLWQEPMRSFEKFNMNITVDKGVQLVPDGWLARGGKLNSGYKYASVDIPRLEREMLSWSTVHAQCRPSDPNPLQWVHLLTIPLIAVCSERLATLGMCNASRSSQDIVMVGSSWIAVSLESYAIRQCASPAARSRDIFANSSLCNLVFARNNKTLTCVDGVGEFIPNNYQCKCPDGTYYSPSHDTSSPPAAYRNSSSDARSSYPGYLVKQWVVGSEGNVSVDSRRAACIKCERGCMTCTDSSPCLRVNDLRLQVPLLLLTLLVMVGVGVVTAVLWRSWESQIVVSSVGAYLVAILFSAIIAYLEGIVLFPALTDTTCAIQPWPRHIGFILVFGFLFAKVWRVQVLARMPPGSISPSHLDRMIVMCISFLAAMMVVFLVVWTAVSPPRVEIGKDSNDRTYEKCSIDSWRFAVHGVEVLLLLLACLVAHRTRHLVLEWPEFKFITLPFLNAAIIKSLIAIFYFTLMPNKYADHLYLLQFFEMHFTITSLVAVLCGHKLYFIIRRKEDRDVGPTVPLKNVPNPSAATTSPVDRFTFDSTMSGAGEGRRGSDNAEVHSIAEYQQQQLQVYPNQQQGQDCPQVLVVPGEVSLRDVLLSCIMGSTADDWEATDNGTVGVPPPARSRHQSVDQSLGTDHSVSGGQTSSGGNNTDDNSTVKESQSPRAHTKPEPNGKVVPSILLSGGLYGGMPRLKHRLSPEHRAPAKQLEHHETSL